MVARVTGRSLEEERHLPNPNQTDVRWGLGGTDLGIIWEIAPGRYGLFFGDSYGSDFVPVAGGGPGAAGDWRSNVLAYSEDSDLSDGLTFSGMAVDPNNAGRAREIIPGRTTSSSLRFPLRPLHWMECNTSITCIGRSGPISIR